MPFYILVDAQWFDSNPSTVGSRVLKGGPFHVIPVNGEHCAAIFTTEAEANKYLKSKNLESKNRSIQLEMPHECATVLELFIRAGIKQVFLDAADTIPGLYPIDYFLAQVRAARLERGDNRAG